MEAMGLEVVGISVLQVCKIKITVLARLADHYFLSEHNSLDHSVGWGPAGMEIRGRVRVSKIEQQRIERFVAAARYDIAVNNCEHFAYYVVHGLALSTQQHTWWKDLSAKTIRILQPTQSKRSNISDAIGREVGNVLNENLRQSRIRNANQERIAFWDARGLRLE
ncbi:hypothetical protein KBY76_00765 [Synechococcus sp. GreenBA-s]|nr:hypothetical protein [Synechococcus sp. GreenBA-s]